MSEINEMKDYGFHLRSALRRLDSFGDAIRSNVQNIQDGIKINSYEKYEELRYEALTAIGLAKSILEVLNILSHLVEKPEDRTIVGALRKNYLFLEAKQINKYSSNLLSMSTHILESEFNSVPDMTMEIIELLEKLDDQDILLDLYSDQE